MSADGVIKSRPVNEVPPPPSILLDDAALREIRRENLRKEKRRIGFAILHGCPLDMIEPSREVVQHASDADELERWLARVLPLAPSTIPGLVTPYLLRTFDEDEEAERKFFEDIKKIASDDARKLPEGWEEG